MKISEQKEIRERLKNIRKEIDNIEFIIINQKVNYNHRF